jgi:hypothetical protein
MRQRCLNPKAAFWADYGGRGITICERWSSFAAFLEDMGPTYAQGLTLERRDNNTGYSPRNCYWATAQQQARNRRSNRWVDTPAGRMLLTDAAEHFGIRFDTLRYRLKQTQDPSIVFARYDHRISTIPTQGHKK